MNPAKLVEYVSVEDAWDDLLRHVDRCPRCFDVWDHTELRDDPYSGHRVPSTTGPLCPFGSALLAAYGDIALERD